MQTIDKKDIVNVSHSRRVQIAHWFNDVINANGLTKSFIHSQNLMHEGKTQESYDAFYGLVFYMIDTRENLASENGDTLAYLFSKNIDRHGAFNTISLYWRMLIKVPRKRVKQFKPRDRRLANIEREISKDKRTEQKRKFYFGINTEGKREKAIPRVVIDKKGDTKIMLKSVDSGKFIKWSNSFKQEIERRRGNEKPDS